jgi:hypothetical protein
MEIYEGHLELFHYTKFKALEGIVASNSIWATRYDRMNDTSEVIHLRDYLFRSLEPYAIEIAKQYVRGSLKRKRQADKFGGIIKAARHNANETIRAAYDVSFLGRGGQSPHFVPYIASFCGHTGDSEYVRANGLLSQWRAYGDCNERFALVFDTQGLHELLLAESKLFAFSPLRFVDVVYDDDSFDFDARFPVLAAELRRHHSSLYEDQMPDFSESKLPEEFIAATTCLKSRGFSEEREVRIVAVPLTTELRKNLIESTGEDEAAGRALIPIKHRDRDGVDVPYVSLFETQGRSLPIKRIIVGPCRDQDGAVARVCELTRGLEISIHKSSVPLRDW